MSQIVTVSRSNNYRNDKRTLSRSHYVGVIKKKYLVDVWAALSRSSANTDVGQTNGACRRLF